MKEALHCKCMLMPCGFVERNMTVLTSIRSSARDARPRSTTPRSETWQTSCRSIRVDVPSSWVDTAAIPCNEPLAHKDIPDGPHLKNGNMIISTRKSIQPIDVSAMLDLDIRSWKPRHDHRIQSAVYYIHEDVGIRRAINSHLVGSYS
jgi:hypothetical protein